MGMKGKLGMIGMLSTLALVFSETPKSNREYIEPKETDEERKDRMFKAEIENKKTKGLKEFFYGENSLFALNKKNADRKAKSNGWI